MGAKGETSQHVAADNGFSEGSCSTSPFFTFLHSFSPPSTFSCSFCHFSSLIPPLLSHSHPSFFFCTFLPCLSLSSSSHSLPCYPLMYFLCVWPQVTGRRVICLKERRTATTDCYKLWHQPWLRSWEEAFYHIMLLLDLFPHPRDSKSLILPK